MSKARNQRRARSKNAGMYYTDRAGNYAHITGSFEASLLTLRDGVTKLEKLSTGSVPVRDLFELNPGWDKITAAEWRDAIAAVKITRLGAGENNAIAFAFEVGGRKFYKYVNDFDMPIMRWKEAESVYFEFQARMSREYLFQFLEELSKALNEGNLVRGASLASDAIVRARMLFDFDLYLKLGSVYYFDLEENTSKYDHLYNEKKIAFWKENVTDDGFFFETPFSELVKLDNFSTDDLRAYTKQAEVIKALTESRLQS